MSYNNYLPMVSIITPSYNSMPFIEETILSVKNQDYDGNIEHIIFDAQSKDGTIEIVQKYDNINFISEPDSGQSDAINKGFNLSKGEIIGWINSDDFYEAGVIKKVVKFFSENPKTDMIHGDINIVDDSSIKLGSTFGLNIKNPIDLLRNNVIKQPTIFIRRRIIDDLKGVNKKLHWTMDREFWLRILLNGYNVVYLKNLKIANFRVCEGRKSHDNPDKMIEEWINVIENYFDEGIYFSKVNKKVKNSIINEKKSDYYAIKMKMCFEKNKKFSALKNFFKSVFYNTKIALNMGLWKNLIAGLIGVKINKYRKFKKNEFEAKYL
jgi:glycosyltransferase involved in cell wall biosynthesis